MPDAPMGLGILEAMSRGGVVVVEVVAGSPADAAGLKPGQVITRVAGKPVRSPRQFAEAVAGLKGPVPMVTESDAQPVIVK